IGLLPLFLLDGFADRGNRFSFVSGVNAGRIYLMFVPSAARQTFRRGQLPFALDQHAVNLDHGGGGQRASAVGFGGIESFLIFGSAAGKSVCTVLQRSKIQIGRHVFLFWREVRL